MSHCKMLLPDAIVLFVASQSLSQLTYAIRSKTLSTDLCTWAGIADTFKLTLLRFKKDRQISSRVHNFQIRRKGDKLQN